MHTHTCTYTHATTTTSNWYQVWDILIAPGEPLAIGYFVAPSKEKKIYKIKLKVKVKLINKIMQKHQLVYAHAHAHTTTCTNATTTQYMQVHCLHSHTHANTQTDTHTNVYVNLHHHHHTVQVECVPRVVCGDQYVNVLVGIWKIPTAQVTGDTTISENVVIVPVKGRKHHQCKLQGVQTILGISRSGM